MSLFPAYAQNENKEVGESSNLQEEQEKRPAWLNIDSFSVNLTDIPLPSELQTITNESTNITSAVNTDAPKEITPVSKGKKKTEHRKKKVKQKSHKKQEEVLFNENGNLNFCEDKSGVNWYIKVKTLPKSFTSRYNRRYCILGKQPYKFNKKKKMNQRYFSQLLGTSEESSTTKPESASVTSEEGCQTFHLEEELSKRTSNYNKMITDDPKNVDIWLEYVKFQDVIQQFEQSYRRGASAKSLRVTAERKISILDKALMENPQNERLLQERTSLAECLYPADTLVQHLSQMVDKSPNSIVIWRSYVRATQGSLTLCNTSAVLKLYEKGLRKMHQLRRGASVSTVLPMESGILDLLLDVGFYLRQAGLWEQLWMLLRMYLELNLSQPDSDIFKNVVAVPETLITGLEETILNSQLPLPELWYRIEKLREAAHWLPWSSDAECEDPQRLVFVDDVSDMLYPITSTHLCFRLALITMTLLKIPILPWRHTSMQVAGLDQVPSNLDCVEVLLAMYYSHNMLVVNDQTFLQGALHLVYGPQYLSSSWPGQEHYLEFVIKVFRSCAICLKEPAKTAMFIWWLRFERFLVVLGNIDHCKLPHSSKKKIKSSIKDFLKQEENRSNGLFYVEYALFEFASGQVPAACKVLTTAISAHGVSSVINIGWDDRRNELCRMYRTLCEILISSTSPCENVDMQNKNSLLAVILGLVLGTSLANWQTATVSSQEIETAADKFRHITTELLCNVDSEEADGTEHLLPDFIVDWIACYGWWLLFTRNIWEAGTVFEEALQKIPAAKSSSSTPVLKSTCHREGIYESYVGILYYYCKNNPGVYPVLQDALHRGLQEFPNNLHLLSVIANVENTVGCSVGSWWKLTKYFQESNCILAQVFQIFYMRYQGGLLHVATQQSYEFLNVGGPLIPDPSIKNRLSALYNRLLNDSSSKRCPMIWRLYLRFLAEHSQEASYHSAFYRAVEECPWVKVLYTEAVKLLPAELPQLQDLLVEKELRMHITPEELDILRKDPTEIV